jgi:ABC-2 type transport system permease protein
MIMRSPFDGCSAVLYPLFFATVAFFVFRSGGDARPLLYASLGRAVMGIWSATSTTRLGDAARALARARSSCSSRRRRTSRSSCCRHDRAGDDRHLQHGRHAALGRLAFGVDLTIGTRCCSRSRSRPRCSRSACSASCSRSLRPLPHRLGAREHARVPVWLICGFLVPLSLFPDWVRPISWVLAPTWGMNAIRESALGGSPLPICSCASARRRYIAIGVRSSTALLRRARARARSR